MPRTISHDPGRRRIVDRLLTYQGRKARQSVSHIANRSVWRHAAEVLAGARGDKDRQRLLTFLGPFQPAPIRESTWDIVGEKLASLLTSGITVPFPDAVVATVAIEGQMEVWARDPHFPLMQKVLPRLQLYQEPP